MNVHLTVFDTLKMSKAIFTADQLETLLSRVLATAMENYPLIPFYLTGIKVNKLTHTDTHIYLTKQVTRKGEAPIVLATRDRLTGKKEIDRITNKLMKQLLL